MKERCFRTETLSVEDVQIEDIGNGKSKVGGIKQCRGKQSVAEVQNKENIGMSEGKEGDEQYTRSQEKIGHANKREHKNGYPKVALIFTLTEGMRFSKF